MKMKTAVLTALAVMAVSATCMAAPGFDVVSVPGSMSRQEFCEAKMEGWADRLNKGADFTTIRNEADKIYVAGDNRIAYYDEWVSLDKEDQRAFARIGIARLGAPQELADKLMAGNGEDRDEDEAE